MPVEYRLLYVLMHLHSLRIKFRFQVAGSSTESSEIGMTNVQLGDVIPTAPNPKVPM
jgi:hypothetical protein